MTELTKAEEQVMQYLWRLEKGFLKDIVDQFPQPKPAYTTVSTVIRVLVKKGVIGFNTYGKIHEYYPLLSKNEYFRNQMRSLVRNFFNGSTTSFVSAFTETENLSISELEKIKDLIDIKIKEKDKE